MRKLLASLQKAADWLDADDEPGEAAYDPVQLGEVLVAAFVVIGALYWLLWALLVYEGGIFVKLQALARWAGGRSLAELGYRGDFDRGPFEGWLGNAVALALCAGALAGLHRLYRQAARKARRE